MLFIPFHFCMFHFCSLYSFNSFSNELNDLINTKDINTSIQQYNHDSLQYDVEQIVVSSPYKQNPAKTSPTTIHSLQETPTKQNLTCSKSLLSNDQKESFLYIRNSVDRELIVGTKVILFWKVF